MQEQNKNTPHSEINITEDIAISLGLTAAEYQQIIKLIQRTPTYTELGMFSVL